LALTCANKARFWLRPLDSAETPGTPALVLAGRRSGNTSLHGAAVVTETTPTAKTEGTLLLSRRIGASRSIRCLPLPLIHRQARIDHRNPPRRRHPDPTARTTGHTPKTHINKAPEACEVVECLFGQITRPFRVASLTATAARRTRGSVSGCLSSGVISSCSSERPPSGPGWLAAPARARPTSRLAATILDHPKPRRRPRRARAATRAGPRVRNSARKSCTGHEAGLRWRLPSMVKDRCR
jgi:hypothetical protein